MNNQRCLILFLLLCLFYVFNYFHLKYIDNVGENFYLNSNKNKLLKIYDILHLITPHISKYEYASDIFILLIILYLLFVNQYLFYNYIGYLLTIFIIRSITIFVTILPKNSICDIKKTSSFRGGCYDKVFSGHFSLGLLASLMLYKNNYINYLFLIFFNLINALFIILARNHYTIDIIVSFFITLFIYQNKINICFILDKYCK